MPPNIHHWARIPAAAACALLFLVAFSEAWGGSTSDRRAEVLQGMPEDPDLLINLSPWEMPSTSDMVQLGRAITPALSNGLINNMDPEVRRICAVVLSSTRDPAALQSLLDALEDPNYRVQTQAISALSSLEGRQATPALLQMLAKPRVPSYVKDEVVYALGRRGDPAAVMPLMKHFLETWDPAAQQALWDLRRHLSSGQRSQLVVAPLKDRNPERVPWEVLEFSIDKAGTLKLRPATAPLRKLADARPEQQNKIIWALGMIGDRSSVPYLAGLLDKSADARLLNNVVFALDRLGEDTEPFLAQALKDRRAYIRFNAAFVAGDLGNEALVDELISGLGDPNDYVRSEVAVALGRIGSLAAIPALETAAEEDNPIVRRDALLALAAIDYGRYRDRVVDELVTSEMASVRDKAVRFLAQQHDTELVSHVLATLSPMGYSDQAVGLMLLDGYDRLDNPDATAFLVRVAAGGSDRHRALRILARHRDERARFLLRQWLTQPAGAQDQLLRAMALMGDSDSRTHAEYWRDQPRVRSQLYASFLLASLGEAAAADQLLQAVEDSPPELKRVAATLLTELDLQSIDGLEDRLAGLLEHEDVYVRLYAARALAQQGDPRAFALLHEELDKKVPFVRDEVLDITERTPPLHRDPVVEDWLGGADTMLRLDLERILGQS